MNGQTKKFHVYVVAEPVVGDVPDLSTEEKTSEIVNRVMTFQW